MTEGGDCAAPSGESAHSTDGWACGVVGAEALLCVLGVGELLAGPSFDCCECMGLAGLERCRLSRFMR